MRRFALAVAVLVLSLAPSTEIVAEDSGPEARSKVVVRDPGKLALMSLLDVHFRDATVEHALTSIQTALDGRLQFVVESSVRDVRLPDLTVKNAPAIEIIHLMTRVMRGLHVRIPVGADEHPVGDVLSELNGDNAILERWGSANKTQVVIVEMVSDEEFDGRGERMLRIYQTGHILDGYEVSIDDLATAIETAWDTVPINHVATLKYHEQTKLLICYGTQRHLSLVNQVIEGITGEAPSESEVVQAERATETAEKQHAWFNSVGTQLTQTQNKIRNQAKEIESLRARVNTLQVQLDALQAALRSK